MIQGMTMACPPGWLDKSMLIMRAEAPGESGTTPNIVVTRDRMPTDLPAAPTERMHALLDRQVAEMKTKLAGFVEISRAVGGAEPTIRGELKVGWTSGEADLTQSLTFVDAGDGDLLVATGTAGRSDFADAEPRFNAMLQSFKIA